LVGSFGDPTGVTVDDEVVEGLEVFKVEPDEGLHPKENGTEVKKKRL